MSPSNKGMVLLADSCRHKLELILLTILSLAFLMRMLLDNLLTFKECKVHSLSSLNSIHTVESGSKESECLRMRACSSLTQITKASISRLGTEACRVYAFAKRKLHEDVRSALRMSKCTANNTTSKLASENKIMRCNVAP